MNDWVAGLRIRASIATTQRILGRMTTGPVIFSYLVLA